MVGVFGDGLVSGQTDEAVGNQSVKNGGDDRSSDFRLGYLIVTKSL